MNKKKTYTSCVVGVDDVAGDTAADGLQLTLTTSSSFKFESIPFNLLNLLRCDPYITSSTFLPRGCWFPFLLSGVSWFDFSFTLWSNKLSFEGDADFHFSYQVWADSVLVSIYDRIHFEYLQRIYIESNYCETFLKGWYLNVIAV